MKNSIVEDSGDGKTFLIKVSNNHYTNFIIEQTYDGFHENGVQGITAWLKIFRTNYPTVYAHIKNEFTKTGFLLNDNTEIRNKTSNIFKIENDNDKHDASIFSCLNHKIFDVKSSNWTKKPYKKKCKNLNERNIFESGASLKA